MTLSFANCFGVDCTKETEVHTDGTIEIWKPVVRWEESYRVSNMGRVKSVNRIQFRGNCFGGLSKHVIKGKILKQGSMKRKKGNRPSYNTAHLWNPDRNKLCLVHRLVLLAFVGPCPEGMECCHNDGNPKNNRLDNLRWDTPKNNQLDRGDHGTKVRGHDVYGSKLSKEQVLEIRKDYQSGKKGIVKRMKEKYCISGASIFNIIKRKTWSHI